MDLAVSYRHRGDAALASSKDSAAPELNRSVLNNLAVAYYAMGRSKDARALRLKHSSQHWSSSAPSSTRFLPARAAQSSSYVYENVPFGHDHLQTDQSAYCPLRPRWSARCDLAEGHVSTAAITRRTKKEEPPTTVHRFSAKELERSTLDSDEQATLSAQHPSIRSYGEANSEVGVSPSNATK